MTNAARGESTLTLGGADYTLCLTLGALAEIEEALGIESINEIGKRLEKPRARDLVAVLGALIRGGGGSLTNEELAALPLDLEALSPAIGGALTGGASTSKKKAAPRGN